MKIQYLALLIVVSSGCHTPDRKARDQQDEVGSESEESVEFKRYRGKNELRKAWNGTLKITTVKDTTTYEYTSLNSEFDIDLLDIAGRDSVLFWGRFPMPLTDKKVIEIENKKFIVLSYYYDDPGMSDEEMSIYFVNKLGLIGTKGAEVGCTMISRADREFNGIVDNLLQDTTGFFGPRPPPKPTKE